jgi:hypothetical protein
MLQLFLRLITFLVFSALNGAFAQAEIHTQVKANAPREDTVFAVVAPPRGEVMNSETATMGLAIALPKLASETEFVVAKYVFTGTTRTTKHRARAPPTL